MISQRELDILHMEAQRFVRDLFTEFHLARLGKRAFYFEEEEEELPEEELEVENAEIL